MKAQKPTKEVRTIGNTSIYHFFPRHNIQLSILNEVEAMVMMLEEKNHSHRETEGELYLRCP